MSGPVEIGSDDVSRLVLSWCAACGRQANRIRWHVPFYGVAYCACSHFWGTQIKAVPKEGE